MVERIYGGNSPSYGVIEEPGGPLQLRVYHTNREMRKSLEQHRYDPRYFLLCSFHPRVSAQRWLAAVIADYHTYFAQNLVTIVFCIDVPRAEKSLHLTGSSMSDNIESLW